MNLYKKIIGTSIACLSLITCSNIGAKDVHASSGVTIQQQVKPIAINEVISFGTKIQNESLKYLNAPRVNGGTTPAGFDCSGFTMYVFNNLGFKIPRVASDQANMNNLPGYKDKVEVISKKDVQAGDLVFFNNYGSGGVGHVGIALDNNRFIHSSSSGKRILIASNSSSYYNSSFVKAIRVK